MAGLQEFSIALDDICIDPPASVIIDLTGLADECYSPLILTAVALFDLRCSGSDVWIDGADALVHHIFHLAGFDGYPNYSRLFAGKGQKAAITPTTSVSQLGRRADPLAAAKSELGFCAPVRRARDAVEGDG